ncbi:MAG: hypothetical protein AB7G08_31205 [Hyphomicrobiaceae bacterium]
MAYLIKLCRRLRQFATETPVRRGKSMGRRALLAALSVLMFAATAGSVMADDMPDAGHRADGLVIYFAAIPAAFVLAHPAEHTGRGMHGDTPDGRYVHHLIVALLDSKTGVRITDARILAVIRGGVSPSETRVEFGPMAIAGAPVYGGFADLPPRDRYRIEIEVVRPNGDAVVRTVFWHQHLQPQP